MIGSTAGASAQAGKTADRLAAISAVIAIAAHRRTLTAPLAVRRSLGGILPVPAISEVTVT
jgi:hypothetical protein